MLLDANGRPIHFGNRKPRADHKDDVYSPRRVLYNSRYWPTVNPDNAVLSRVTSRDSYYRYPYGVLDEMPEKDPHLAAVIELRKQAVLDGNMTILPRGEHELAIALRDWSEWAVDRIGRRSAGDWRSVSAGMLDAIGHGHQPCELIWDVDNNEAKDYWILDNIVARYHRRFTFDNDNQLNIVKGYNSFEIAPREQFVNVVLYPYRDSPWGQSLLARTYPFWNFKKAVVSYWIGYCERFGMPLPVGRFDAAPGFTPGPEEIDAFEAMLRDIQQEQYALLMPGQVLDIADFANGQTAEVYEAFTNFADRQMSKLWLGATMIIEESKNGTQAMATTLEGRFLSKVAADGRALSNVWTNMILPLLIEANFGPEAVQYGPIMTIQSKEQKDLKAEAEVVSSLYNMGLSLSKSALRKNFGLQAPDPDDPDDELVKAAGDSMLSPADVVNNNLPDNTGNQPDDTEASNTMHEGSPAALPAVSVSSGSGSPGRAAFAEAGQFTPSAYSMEIAVAVDKNREAACMTEVHRQALRDEFELITEQMQKHVKAKGSVRAALEDVQAGGYSVNVEGLATALSYVMQTCYLHGYIYSANTYNVTNRADRVDNEATALDAPARFDEVDSFASVRAEAESLNLVTRREFDRLDSWAKSEAYTAAWQTRDTIQTAYQRALLDAIEEGYTVEEVVNALYPQWKGPAGAGIVAKEAHIENVLRTNSMKAYNHGWADLALDPELDDELPAGELVAIIDDRTTELCAFLNGRVVMREEIGEFTPPFHYMCRTVMVFLNRSRMSSVTMDRIVSAREMRNQPEDVQIMDGFGKYTRAIGGS